MAFPLCSTQSGADAVAFSSSAFGTNAAPAGTDFWSKELAWQQEELKNPFAITVSIALLLETIVAIRVRRTRFSSWC